MKERQSTFLISVVLSLTIAVSCTCCFISAFSLELAHFPRILLLCLFAALTESLLFSRRNGDIWVLCLLAAGAGFLWYGDQLSNQTAMLICQVVNTYDRVYHWGGFLVPEWAPYVDYPLAAGAVFLVSAVCFSISCRRSSAIAVIVCLLVLQLCMVVPDTVPGIPFLLVLLAGLALLVLTSSVRRESASQGNRLTLAAALPLLAAAGLLLLVCPPGSYVDHTQGIRDYAAAQLQRLPGFLPGSGNAPFVSRITAKSDVDLTALEDAGVQRLPVMGVTAQTSGTLYLRGQDFDVYTGTGWESSGSRSEEFGGWGEPEGLVLLRTFGLHDVLYLPYFPDQGAQLSDGMVRNTRNLLEYTLPRLTSGSAAAPETLSRCLALPETTAAEVKPFLPSQALSTADKVHQIGSIVRSTAVYSRSADKMPSSEADFALWFLNRAKAGYCVHFASTSVVLLRAAGIPARYVTGYKLQAVPGKEVIVTAADAHAWAEYYDSDTGCWAILESTPSEADVPGPGQTTPREPEPTRVPGPTTPTEPSAPSSEAPAPAVKTGWRPLRFLLWLLLLIPLAGLIYVQRLIRLFFRAWQQKRGPINRQALKLWQETELLARLLKETPPEDLSQLAQKARFSQHALEDRELAPFLVYRSRCRRRLRNSPWYLRLLYQYVYALC